jgi:uncharacterized protein YjiS (DUF1127 family)
MASVLTRQTFERSTTPRGVGIVSIFRRLRLAADLWSERRSLGQLDARMLADIGLECWEAEREAARPPWDVPAERVAGIDRYRPWQGF